MFDIIENAEWSDEKIIRDGWIGPVQSDGAVPGGSKDPVFGPEQSDGAVPGGSKEPVSGSSVQSDGAVPGGSKEPVFGPVSKEQPSLPSQPGRN